MSWRRSASLCLMIGLLGTGAPASVQARGRAAAATLSARRHASRAEKEFRVGHYAEALRAYEAGYAAAPLPGFLVNIAQCHRRLGNLAKARAAYQKFVAVAPDSSLRPEVESLIAELDEVLRAAQPSGASAGGSTAAPLSVSAGGGARPALDAAKPATAAPAPAGVSLEIPAETTTSQPPNAARESGTRVWLWTALAASVVGGTVAAFALRPGAPDPVRDGSLGTLRR